MITYGHEKFIEEAIKGVLMQECDFEVELIVANDCSTDNTNEIVERYIETHSRGHLIKYTLHLINKGILPNFIWTLQQCKGKYIALLDGDDYWSDPLKLQKQVDFLEANPDYNICFHNVQLFIQEENKFDKDNITREVPEITNIEDLARGNYIHTPSVVLRNNFTIPKWFSKSPIGDWILYMIAIKDKKVKKLDAIMAVYRVHKTSIWANKSQEYRNKNTHISVKLVLNNLKLGNSSVKILKSRLGQTERKKVILKKLFKRIKNYVIKKF